MDLDRAIAELIEREIEALGYELVQVEAHAAGRRGTLRVYIDRPADPVGIDDCVRVTKALGLVLDGVEAMPGAYTLEISSPGARRPLAKAAHYARFRGERARIAYLDDAGKRTTAIGTIESSDDAGVTIVVDGVARTVPFERVIRAHLHPDDGERPRPEETGRRGRARRRGETL